MIDQDNDLYGAWINGVYFEIGRAEEKYGAALYSASFAEHNAVTWRRARPAWLDKEIGR